MAKPPLSLKGSRFVALITFLLIVLVVVRAQASGQSYESQQLALGTPYRTTNLASINKGIAVNLQSQEDGVLVVSFNSTVRGSGVAILPRLGNKPPEWTVFPFKRSTAVKSYEISNPKISPNGRYVLFRFGDPYYPLNGAALYVLDIGVSKLSRPSIRLLANAAASWSPDSEYITFIENGTVLGDVVDSTGHYVGPLRLLMCHWHTGRTQLVAEGDHIGGQFSWRTPHTLFYSKVSASIATIGEYDFDSKRNRKSMPGHVHPAVSRDGSLMASFGPEDPIHTTPFESWNSANRFALVVSRIDEGTRTVLTSESGRYPQIFWCRDNRHILTLKETGRSLEPVADIREWDVQSGKFRNVARMPAHDQIDVSYIQGVVHFIPFDLSSDNKRLILLSVEYLSADPKEPRLLRRVDLKAVDLLSGAITNIADFTGRLGIDWQSHNS